MVSIRYLKYWIGFNVILISILLIVQPECPIGRYMRCYDWEVGLVLLGILNLGLLFTRRVIFDNCPVCGSYNALNRYNYDKAMVYTTCNECGYDGPFDTGSPLLKKGDKYKGAGKYGNRTFFGIKSIENVKHWRSQNIVATLSSVIAVMFLIPAMMILLLLLYTKNVDMFLIVIMVTCASIAFFAYAYKIHYLTHHETGIKVLNSKNELVTIKDYIMGKH